MKQVLKIYGRFLILLVMVWGSILGLATCALQNVPDDLRDGGTMTGALTISSGSLALTLGSITLTNGSILLVAGDLTTGLNQKLILDDDLDSYIQCTADDQCSLYASGNVALTWRAGSIETASGRSGLMNEVPNATNPTVVPSTNDPDTGLGTSGADCLSLVAGGVEVARLCESTDSLFSVTGGFKPVSKTSDPCADTTNFPPGAEFYNSTTGVQCYCNNSNADVRSADGTTACF